MISRLWMASLRAALTGHAVALLTVLLLSWLALFLDNPSSAILPVALVSLGTGAFVVGLAVRKRCLGVLGALLGGGTFVLPLLISSCFGKGESFSFGARCLVLAAAMTVVVTVLLFFPKAKSRKHRKKSFSVYRR